MARYPCPICHDPNAYPWWFDEEPPAGCPRDMAWQDGGPPAITEVTQCRYQMGKARQRAEFRKVAPHCFDKDGNILPDRIGEVITLWAATYPPGKVPPLYFG